MLYLDAFIIQSYLNITIILLLTFNYYLFITSAMGKTSTEETKSYVCGLFFFILYIYIDFNDLTNEALCYILCAHIYYHNNS